jgi:hypothetical protein
VFTFTDPELLARRLGTSNIVLDHVACAVADIDAVAAAMKRAGVHFSEPDLQGEIDAPIVLSGVRHLWTIPETSRGQSIQLVQR